MVWFIRILGLILLLGGAVWFLQGINVLPIGFMAGRLEWSVRGVIAAVIGLGLLYWTYRGRGNSSTAGKRS
ncbi:MAG: hypothetical protein ACM3JD_10610 [Rudaea sp.]